MRRALLPVLSPLLRSSTTPTEPLVRFLTDIAPNCRLPLYRHSPFSGSNLGPDVQGRQSPRLIAITIKIPWDGVFVFSNTDTGLHLYHFSC